MRISCGQYVWILCVNVSFLSTCFIFLWWFMVFEFVLLNIWHYFRLFIWRDCLTFRSTWVHIHLFCGLRVAQYLGFCVMFCISLFARLYLFFSWPLCCPHFDIWLLITPLTSSSFTCAYQVHILKRVWRYPWGNQNP